MANYIFETMSAADAAAFTKNDYLIFTGSSTTAANVQVTQVAAPSGDTTNASDFGTTLTVGSISRQFDSTAISTAAGADHVIFNNNTSHLRIGVGTDDETFTTTNGTKASAGTVVYAFGGDDTVNLNGAPDYVYGGVGDDTIGSAAANGNYHIYGNAAGNPAALTSTQSDDDTIVVGIGTNYIQGNAGKDQITAGTAASTGYNRIFGGGDADTIVINGAIGSLGAINGNKGNDTITDASNGSNTIRGGADDDTITQTGASHDTIMGDLGDDTIKVSGAAGHIVQLTGGAGKDVFDFTTAGSANASTINPTTGASVAVGTNGSVTYYQEITDFTAGTDRIDVTATISNGTIGYSDTVFASVTDAQTYAQTQLGTVVNGNTINVSSLSVGTSSASAQTYVFYTEATKADSIIHLDNVAASAVKGNFFI